MMNKDLMFGENQMFFSMAHMPDQDSLHSPLRVKRVKKGKSHRKVNTSLIRPIPINRPLFHMNSFRKEKRELSGQTSDIHSGEIDALRSVSPVEV